MMDISKLYFSNFLIYVTTNKTIHDKITYVILNVKITT